MKKDKTTITVHHDMDTYIRSLISRSYDSSTIGDVILPVVSKTKFKQAFEDMVHSSEATVGLNMVDKLGTDRLNIRHRFYLTDKSNNFSNFRYKLDVAYKSDRKKLQPTSIESIFFSALLDIDRISEYLDINIIQNPMYIEADDMISLAMRENDVIVTTDKDLNIAYNTVNPITSEFTVKNEKKLYELLLVGDKADSITGIKGYGAVKAGKVLGLPTYEEIVAEVEEIYTTANEDIKLKRDLLQPLTWDKVVIQGNTLILNLESKKLELELSTPSLELFNIVSEGEKPVEVDNSDKYGTMGDIEDISEIDELFG